MLAWKPCREHDARLDCVHAQTRIFESERQRHGNVALLGCGISIHPWLSGTARLSFVTRACLGRDITVLSETCSYGDLAFGVFGGRADEEHVSSIFEIGQESVD